MADQASSEQETSTIAAEPAVQSNEAAAASETSGIQRAQEIAQQKVAGASGSKKKRKKKKKKNGAKAAEPALSEQEEMLKLLGMAQPQAAAAAAGDSKAAEHKFWDSEPVPKLGDQPSDHSAIDVEKDPATDIRQEPYRLPKGFNWVSLDVSNAKELQEMYTLLTENYVEDDDNMFRFDYSTAFLTWALTPPDFNAEWHVGVRQTSNGRLRALITGIPATISAHGREMKVAEINFLCVHKRLRSKRLAPVLIKEVTRRVNLTGVFQAVYTAGVVLPKPVSSCRYYHRSLNPKKLIEVGFSRLAPRMTLSRTIRLYRLPQEPTVAGFRELQPGDMPEVTALLNTYLSQFKLHCIFAEAELAHVLLPREGVVNSYVVVSGETGKVTDLCSFYHLPSTIIGHDKHSDLRAAYSYYNVSTVTPLKDLIYNALIQARLLGFDVFNALDLMHNEAVFKDLKFGPGDGNLQYYLYNWRCPEIKPSDVAIVLL